VWKKRRRNEKKLVNTPQKKGKKIRARKKCVVDPKLTWPIKKGFPLSDKGGKGGIEKGKKNIEKVSSL